ncbi:unnamed protein product [Mycena citricolor]|uniref:Uncharacterized protein n=1 Tax=Mycena citricolor TaxID=2018698 RepID=A0AAD2HME4_9AGAR|nr:unnamed protein product [Mycena citricolor]
MPPEKDMGGPSNPTWYDPKESEWDFEHPKYWSEEDQEVFVGIRDGDEPTKLETLCGTYRWFYDFPEPGTTEPNDISYDNSDASLPHPGYLTISSTGKRPTLKNITGTVVVFGKEAKFSGIKRAKDRDKNHLVDNHWEFVTFKWKESYGPQLQDEGNSLVALDVMDDGGDPFVMMRCTYPGPSGHTWYRDLAAKKERRPKRHGLSDAERARLHMEVHYPEVRAAAQAKAAAGKAAAESSSSEEESDEDSSSDENVASRRRGSRPGKRKQLDSLGSDTENRGRKRKA